MNENVMEPRNNQKEKSDEKCNKISTAEVKTTKASSMLKCDVWRAKILTDKVKMVLIIPAGCVYQEV